jgi:hypothetical protein
MLLSLTIDLLNPVVVGLAADGCEKNWWHWVGVELYLTHMAQQWLMLMVNNAIDMLEARTTGKEVRGDQLKTSWKCIQAMAEKMMMVGVRGPWN